jgi:hypothetical protein
MTTINPMVYRTIVIAKGLEFYAKTGMKVNTAYTPRRMMRVAEEITGRKFKARAYMEAANALRTSIGMEAL